MCKNSPDEERHLTYGNDYRAVPPGHGDGFFVRFVNEVIGVVVFEDVVMDEGVAFKGVAEKFHKIRFVHEITVQGPFEYRSKNGP